MAEELLAKESVTLVDIVRILGHRPYPLKESLKEYLKEMLERKDIEDKKGEVEEAGGVPVSTSTTPTG